jgi:hypothetical protein
LPSAGCTDCGNAAGRQGGGISANGIGAQTVIPTKGIVRTTSRHRASRWARASIQSGSSASSSTTHQQVTIIGNSVSANAPTRAAAVESSPVAT